MWNNSEDIQEVSLIRSCLINIVRVQLRMIVISPVADLSFITYGMIESCPLMILDVAHHPFYANYLTKSTQTVWPRPHKMALGSSQNSQFSAQDRRLLHYSLRYHFTMKSFAFFASLAVAITAFANPNPLEKRQVGSCPGFCGVDGVAVTLSAPVSVSVVTFMPAIGPVTIDLSEDFTTTISPTCVGTSCACTPVVDDPISTIPVTVPLPVPTILTSLGVPVPTILSLGFTGTLTVPAPTVSNVGVSDWYLFSTLLS